jgi:acid stress-induced BolA-like protein IbaG/YrbA
MQAPNGISSEQIKALIERGIEAAEVMVDGDGAHFAARVVSDAFAGKSPVKRHQMVYATLGDSFKSVLHALSIQTYTREEWKKAAPSQTL